MIKEVTMYSVVCDRCGKTYGVDDGIDCWVDICTAREQAMDSLHLPFFLRMDGVRDKYSLGIVVFQELNFVQTAVLVGLFQ